MLTRSPVLLRPPRLRQVGASSRPNTLALAGPAGKTPRDPSPPRPARAVRDPQIPIDRAQPKQRPFLSAVSSLGGFRTPTPLPARPSAKGPASETLHHLRRSRSTAIDPVLPFKIGPLS